MHSSAVLSFQVKIRRCRIHCYLVWRPFNLRLNQLSSTKVADECDLYLSCHGREIVECIGYTRQWINSNLSSGRAVTCHSPIGTNQIKLPTILLNSAKLAERHSIAERSQRAIMDHDDASDSLWRLSLQESHSSQSDDGGKAMTSWQCAMTSSSAKGDQNEAV